MYVVYFRSMFIKSVYIIEKVLIFREIIFKNLECLFMWNIFFFGWGWVNEVLLYLLLFIKVIIIFKN